MKLKIVSIQKTRTIQNVIDIEGQDLLEAVSNFCRRSKEDLQNSIINNDSWSFTENELKFDSGVQITIFSNGEL